MFNNARRCLIVSVRIREKFLLRTIHESVLPSKLHSRTNARCSIDTVYKRFYCHATINEQNVTSADLRNQQQKLDQQKLDEFLSEPENTKLFKILNLEIDVLRHNADRVPNNIEAKDWLTLLNTTSKIKRKKLLEFLWRCEIAAINERKKKELKKAERLSKREAEQVEEDTGVIKYGLHCNSLFMRIYETTMNRFFNGKIIQNMMFEPKVVFDCGYESDMTEREIHNCAKQLSLAFASNRGHCDPMYFYFCNFNGDGLLKRYLHQNIPSLMNDDFPVTLTSQSYLDIFPKNQLVYLTPHCRINLNEFDPDAVYIIGALVDKSDQRPLSLAKAKKEGLRMARFPIDDYLDWGTSSSKSLTLDQTIRILLDLKHTKDWREALKNVPVRKLRPARENMLRSKLHRSILSQGEKLEGVNSETRRFKQPIDFTFQSRNKFKAK